MIIDYDCGSVGAWDVMRPRQTLGLNQEAAFAELTGVCEGILSILNHERLLRPNFIQVEDWRERDSGLEIERSPVCLPLSLQEGSSNIAVKVRELVASQSEGGRTQPSRLLVDGEGVILLPGGVEEEQPDVFRVWAKVTLSMIAIELTSQSDVWLPYTLLGDPQPEVRALNAPRLERALKAVENQLGVGIMPRRSTKLADVKRYEVTNILSRKGRVIVPDGVRAQDS